MKKSVLALAVLALSGTAAMADVSLTGLAAISYEKAATDSKGNAAYPEGQNKSVTGYGIPDLALTATAKEDLGGGLSVAAVVGWDIGGARNKATSRDDYSLTLAGGFGSVQGYSKEAGNNGEKFSGAVSLPNGCDSTAATYKSICGHANIKGAAYTTPELAPGLKVAVKFSQYETNAASSNAGIIDPSQHGYYTSKNLTVMYATGPVSVTAGYSAYNDTTVVTTAAKNTHKVDIGATLNLGAVTVGLGYWEQTSNTGVSDAAAPTIVASVAVPVGPVTLGLDYAQRGDLKNAAGTVTTPKISYTAVGAKYNLSKSAWVNVSAGGFHGETDANIAAGAPDNVTQYRLGLWKSF